MTDYGIKCSKPGFDVKTTPSVNLTIDTNLSSFKCKYTLFDSVILNFYSDGSTTAPQTVLTVSHDYGFIPAILTMANYPYGGYANNQWFPLESTKFENPYMQIIASANSTNMIVQFTNLTNVPFTVSNLTLKYYLFAHQGA